MIGEYLNILDGLITTGASNLSPKFREMQARFVMEMMQTDSGFRGRQGGSDLYYTDFALRTLSICNSSPEMFSSSASFVAAKLKKPKDVVECFNGLNAVRILRLLEIEPEFDRAAILDCLASQQLNDGGFARPGGNEISAYNTFLARLCYDILEEEVPKCDSAIDSLYTLKCDDGGFSEIPQEPSQTSSTAAALTFLTITNRLTESDIRDAARFLKSMQTANGGLLPCPGAIESDLLSTFTGLSCLFLTDHVNELDLSAMARMAKSALEPNGGFRACASDPEADVEYTFYGIGILALLYLYRTETISA